MTDADKSIARQAAEYPHLGAKYFAYYLGRNEAGRGYKAKCELTDPILRKEWGIGYREVRREIQLDNDTEWDEEY